MGRNKIHRQRTRYQVSSVRRKTLMSQLAVLFQTELGMSKAESELLGDRIHRYLQVQTESELRSPDQIQVAATSGREAFRRRAPAILQLRITVLLCYNWSAKWSTMLRDREKLSRCQAASNRLSSPTGGPFTGVFEQIPRVPSTVPMPH